MRWSAVAVCGLCLLGSPLGVAAQDASPTSAAATHPAPTMAADGLAIKEIRVLGLKWGDEKLVLRELKSRVGEAYSTARVEEDVRRLDRTDLFSQVEIRPVVEEGEVVLEIEVEETHPWVIFPIIAFSDENDPSYGAGARTMDAFGTGFQAGLGARFGGQDRVSVYARNPFITGNHLGVGVAFSWGKRFNALNEFNEETLTGALKVSSHVGDHGRVAGRFTLETLESDEPGRTLDPSNKDVLPTVAASIGFDDRDVYTNTHRGWWNELEIAWTGGDADYWTFTFDVRRYQPIAERQILFVSSLMSLRTGEVGVDIPVYHDFRFGGRNSIRGWEINQRRGKNQFINSIEYRYAAIPLSAVKILGWRLRTGLELAAFTDFGSLWDESSDFDRFIGGGGVGARVLLPGVGRLRLDVAWGQSDAGVQFAVDFGEKTVKQRLRVR